MAPFHSTLPFYVRIVFFNKPTRQISCMLHCSIASSGILFAMTALFHLNREGHHLPGRNTMGRGSTEMFIGRDRPFPFSFLLSLLLLLFWGG